MLRIPADSQAGSRQGLYTVSNFWQSNFGWKKVAFLEPQQAVPYQLGYRDTITGETKLCAMILSGKTAVLVGSHPTDFFGFSFPAKDPIVLELKGYSQKSALGSEILI